MATPDKALQQPSQMRLAVRTYLRGVGQVMFQQSSWTGLLFLVGIFVGSYTTHNPTVAWGAVVGTFAATVAGFLTKDPDADGDAGLWGFNGILVGCAFPTFLGDTWLMWAGLVLFSMMSTWVRRGFNNIMAAWKINSLTFPFVFLTWIFLFASRMMGGIEITGLSTPDVPQALGEWSLDVSFGSLVVYWLKGISQVFLVDSWITGILFLVGLFLCSRWAAIWAAVGSAISLGLAILFKCTPADISAGLFGFSPVLTAIAVGMTFYQVNWRSAVWTVVAIVATFFIQAAMDVFMEPWGLPTLTGPFCVATWLFLAPLYKFGPSATGHPEWRVKVHELQDRVDAALSRGLDDIEDEIKRH